MTLYQHDKQVRMHVDSLQPTPNTLPNTTPNTTPNAGSNAGPNAGAVSSMATPAALATAAALATPAALAAIALVGSGPWRFSEAQGPGARVQAADGGSTARGPNGGEGSSAGDPSGGGDDSASAHSPFFFLRGGQLHTPWGSAAWAPSTSLGPDERVQGTDQGTDDPLVVYLCGRTKWTHSLRIEPAHPAGAAGAQGAAGGAQGAAVASLNGSAHWAWLRAARLVLTDRGSGEVHVHGHGHGHVHCPDGSRQRGGACAWTWAWTCALS